MGMKMVVLQNPETGKYFKMFGENNKMFWTPNIAKAVKFRAERVEAYKAYNPQVKNLKVVAVN